MAAPVLVLVQNVKTEYREATWEKDREGGVSLFEKIATERTKRDENKPLLKREGVMRTIARLNQGWHLGLTLRRVPAFQPFVNGEEMLGDIAASVTPRLFFPNKKEIHSNEKFRKYTGYKLSKDTSMTIGVLGDFYINFGKWGSFIALFIFGAAIARFLHYFQTKYVLTDPINIVWIPFLLNFLIRADNEFYTIFNCMVKGFLIFLFVLYVERNYWKGSGSR
jgi:hypothetical protein